MELELGVSLADRKSAAWERLLVLCRILIIVRVPCIMLTKLFHI
jgi:hypothetical protein